MSESNEVKFEVGDMVKLKSGGPNMTVYDNNIIVLSSGTKRYTAYWCQWINVKGKVQCYGFRPQCLIKVETQM